MRKNVWDDRDLELGLRDKMTKIIASKISGVPYDEVTPEPEDYITADELAGVIENMVIG